MDCRHIAEQFSEALDTELGPRVIAFDGHLAVCPPCRAAFAAYRRDMLVVSETLQLMAAEVESDPTRSVARPRVVAGPWARWAGSVALAATAAAVSALLVLRPAAPHSAPRAINLADVPAFVAECLEPGYELVEHNPAALQACTEQLVLHHRGVDARGYSFQLVQTAADQALGSCDGLAVKLGTARGCLQVARGTLFDELHWHQDGCCFRLRGNIQPEIAGEVAHDVTRRYAAMVTASLY